MPERTRLYCLLSHIDILRVNEMSQHSYKMPVTIFFCYAHEDEALLKRLQMHLKPLQRGKLVDVLWHDRDISAGMEWQREIASHLDTAQVILLLISPDFGSGKNENDENMVVQGITRVFLHKRIMYRNWARSILRLSPAVLTSLSS